MKYIVTFIIC